MISACYQHKYFTYCDDNTQTDLYKYIKMNGFYFHENGKRKPEITFFYSDGSLANSGLVNIEQSISDQFSKTWHGGIVNLAWYRYKREHDTIKCQSFYRRELGQYSVIEHWYKINSDTMITHIATMFEDNGNKRKWVEGKKDIN